MLKYNEVMFRSACTKYYGRTFRAMAAELSETATEKPMFTCSSCGFECHYEYFGKKPPFSKSVVYVSCFCFLIFNFLKFLTKYGVTLAAELLTPLHVI